MVLFSLFVVLLGGNGPASLDSAGTQKKAQLPNIVFVLADDYGFNDISYHARMNGNDTNIIETPNMDALAATGVKLENYYVQAVCSPTRAAIMTGRYSTHTGIHVPLVDSAPGVLPNEETLIPQLLKQAGYATAMVGKWHLGFRTWTHTPIERGFDTFFGYYAGSTDYFKIQSLCWAGPFPDGCFENENGGEPVSACDLHRHTQTSRESVCNNTEYSTVLFTSEAEAVINSHALKNLVLESQKKPKTPLFLYMAHQAVHVGNYPTSQHPDYWVDQAPLKYIERYSWVEDGGRRNLSAMVTVLDESVGNITRTLKANGMWEHTLLIFSTDNGGPTGVNVPPPQNMKFKQASNYPLKMGKGTNWEGGVRGVGFVAGGSGIGLRSPPGILNKALIHVTDWLPTLCEVAKCQIDSATGHFVGSNKPVDGFSAWAAISKNGTTQRTEIIHDTIESNYAPAIRSGDYKLVGPNSNKEERDEQRARGEDVVYTLYNIATDPSETTDLAAQHPDIVQKLKERIAFYNSTAIPPCDRLLPDPKSNPLKFGNVWTPWDNDTRPGCPQT